MKKILTIIALGSTLASISASAQGYVQFGLGTKSIWDGITTNVMKLNANTLDVAFLWGNGTALISSVSPSTPTNGLATAFSYNPQAAWSAILSDPNYSLASNTNGGAIAIGVTGNGGGMAEYGGQVLGVTGTSSGTSYNVYVIAWSSAYSSPALASAAGAAVGWSAPFSYSFASSIGTPANFSSTAGFTPFGVIAVPEPASFALAGLGAAAMLIFRRRK